MTGEEDEPPAAHERHQCRDGRCDRGELDGERLETLIDGHGRHLVSAITHHIQVAFTTSRRRADHGGEGWQWLARGILDQPGG